VRRFLLKNWKAEIGKAETNWSLVTSAAASIKKGTVGMKACRSQNNKMFAGVCGGLAEELGWSSRRLRVVWVLATIFTAFAGVVLYLALWYLMPKAPPPFEAPLMQPWKHPA
jgi:phage shock protein C